jgi:hypothetical protein
LKVTSVVSLEKKILFCLEGGDRARAASLLLANLEANPQSPPPPEIERAFASIILADFAANMAEGGEE